MGIDLKKEIKLSDLFRRKAKEPTPEQEVPQAEKPEAEKGARKLSLRRGGEKASKAAKPPREPKVKKERKRREKAPHVPAREAPELPAVPLMRAFNLMPGDEARDKKKSGPALVPILVALLGILVFAGLAGGYLLMSGRASDKQAQVDDLRGQLAQLDVPVEEPEAEAEAEDASIAGDAAARTTALAAALGGRTAWDRVLREFSLVLPEDVWIGQITAGAPAAGDAAATAGPAAPAGSSLTVSGFAESQEAVARFLARLAVIPELAGVQLQSSTRQQTTGSTSYSFAIVATVSPQGAAS